MLKKKTILITGGTGSFGQALLDRIIHHNIDIKEIRIFSRDEKKQDDMRQKYNHPKLRFYIGDVRSPSSLDVAMKNVDYVFSAAALKQVPSCEFYPLEAIQTNIYGTENTLASAIQHDVKKVVILSTDKAVYPVNAMGMSKALMEKVMVAKSRNLSSKETILCGTRYGNVMASRGSVIPLFISQIKKNTDLTLTHPKMTRFMMSLDDAIDLVLLAFQEAVQGDLYVQKAPATTMLILAEVLKDIFNSKSKIKIIGIRHGEKTYETLLSKEEIRVSKEIKRKVYGKEQTYFKLPADTRDLNYSSFFNEGDVNLDRFSSYNSNNTHQLNHSELKNILLGLNYIKRELSS